MFPWISMQYLKALSYGLSLYLYWDLGESHYVDLENNIFKRSRILVITTVIVFRPFIKIISQILFSWDPKSLWMMTAAMNYKTLAPWKESYDKLSIWKSKDITLPTEVCIVTALIFPLVMYRCENRTVKKAEHQRIWCFWIVALEKTVESPLDCKEIQPVHPKGNQPWMFTGKTDIKAEAPILWPPDVKSWLIGKDPDAGKD